MAQVKLIVQKYTFKKWRVRRGYPRPVPVWWVERLPYDECQTTRCGPYETYAEADIDRVGMQQIFDGDFT